MKILINGSDLTNIVVENSIELQHYGAYRSNFSFSMEVVNEIPELAAGMEVKFYDEDDEYVWGGILDSCVYIHPVSYTHLDVYKRQVLKREGYYEYKSDSGLSK